MTLERPPWARAALAYAVAVSLVEFALIAWEPRLFRAVVIADASLGWVVVFAALQGLRAVPFPPPLRWMATWCLAMGHWLAAVLGALTVVIG